MGFATENPKTFVSETAVKAASVSHSVDTTYQNCNLNVKKKIIT